MSVEALERFHRDALVGHRPTWTSGKLRGARVFYDEDRVSYRTDDTSGMHRNNFRRYYCEKPQQRYGVAALKALDQLGLDDSVDMTAIRARYKDLVKRLHPDANSGDRSNEERLREIIRAYNYLKSIKHD